MVASQNGHTETASELIAAGANLDVQTKVHIHIFCIHQALRCLIIYLHVFLCIYEICMIFIWFTSGRCVCLHVGWSIYVCIYIQASAFFIFLSLSVFLTHMHTRTDVYILHAHARTHTQTHSNRHAHTFAQGISCVICILLHTHTHAHNNACTCSMYMPPCMWRSYGGQGTTARARARHTCSCR